MQISSLHIQNFIGLENLECKNFSRINVFLGYNNAGKTSLLDALFFNACTISEKSFRRAFEGRNIPPRDVDDLKYFFYDQNYELNPSIEIKMRDTEERYKSELTRKYSHIQIEASEWEKEFENFNRMVIFKSILMVI